MEEIDPRFEILAENLGYSDYDAIVERRAKPRPIGALNGSPCIVLPTLQRGVIQEDRHYLRESIDAANSKENGVDLRQGKDLHSSIITRNQIRDIFYAHFDGDETLIPIFNHKSVELRERFNEDLPSHDAEISAVRILSYSRRGWRPKHTVALVFTKESSDELKREKVEAFKDLTGKKRRVRLTPHVSLQHFNSRDLAENFATDLKKVIEIGRAITFSKVKVEKIKTTKNMLN